jgi:uncharacterized SAM-binding protein YcdF (DUF218 family)
MKFIILIVVIILSIAGITVYLGPNDLAHCKTKPSGSEPCQAADAIVAVSGGDTAARTREAIKLYQNGWAPKLIFSGAAQDKSGPSNAAVMKKEAHEAGVPDADIITEEYSETTKQNAEKTQSIFETNKITSVILVTSAYHQRRAGLEFATRSQGVQVRNHPVSVDNQWSVWWWLTPTGWYLALGEVIKTGVFYLGGSR